MKTELPSCKKYNAEATFAAFTEAVLGELKKRGVKLEKLPHGFCLSERRGWARKLTVNFKACGERGKWRSLAWITRHSGAEVHALPIPASVVEWGTKTALNAMEAEKNRLRRARELESKRAEAQELGAFIIARLPKSRWFDVDVAPAASGAVWVRLKDVRFRPMNRDNFVAFVFNSEQHFTAHFEKFSEVTRAFEETLRLAHELRQGLSDA